MIYIIVFSGAETSSEGLLKFNSFLFFYFTKVFIIKSRKYGQQKRPLKTPPSRNNHSWICAIHPSICLVIKHTQLYYHQSLFPYSYRTSIHSYIQVSAFLELEFQFTVASLEQGYMGAISVCLSLSLSCTTVYQWTCHVTQLRLILFL